VTLLGGRQRRQLCDGFISGTAIDQMVWAHEQLLRQFFLDMDEDGSGACNGFAQGTARLPACPAPPRRVRG
jgi:hypothetical protein